MDLNNWRLLVLSEGRSVRVCFVIIGASSPHVGVVPLLQPILEIVGHLSYSRFSHMELGSGYLYTTCNLR